MLSNFLQSHYIEIVVLKARLESSFRFDKLRQTLQTQTCSLKTFSNFEQNNKSNKQKAQIQKTKQKALKCWSIIITIAFCTNYVLLQWIRNKIAKLIRIIVILLNQFRKCNVYMWNLVIYYWIACAMNLQCAALNFKCDHCFMHNSKTICNIGCTKHDSTKTKNDFYKIMK